VVEFLDSEAGPAMVFAGSDESARALQPALDKLQRVAWIEGMAAWEVMFTGTYRWQSSLDSTRRTFEKFMRVKFPHLSFFYCVEGNPCRDGFHVHAIWADCKGVFRKEAWAEWFKRYGRARIEPVRKREDVCAYASKYLCKGRGDSCWWNVKLQWHWMLKLHGKEFALT